MQRRQHELAVADRRMRQTLGHEDEITLGHVMGDAVTQYEDSVGPLEPDPEYYGFSALYRLYRASDAWIVLCAPEQEDWSRLVAAVPAHRRMVRVFSCLCPGRG